MILQIARESARASRDKNSSTLPIIILGFLFVIDLQQSHIMFFILPPVLELLLGGFLAIAVTPNHLPDALTNDAHGLRPELRDLSVENGCRVDLLLLAEFRGILRGPRHEVRVSHVVQPRQRHIFLGLQPSLRDPAAVYQLPEAVRWVRVRVSPRCRHHAWVETDEDADEVGFQDVRQRRQMGVFGWSRVFRCLPVLFLRRRTGSCR